MKVKLLFVLLNYYTCFNTISFSQVAINSTGNLPDNSAGLDIYFPDKGILIPRISLVDTNLSTPISNPAISLLVYNTTSNASLTEGFYYWNGIKWIKLTTLNDGNNSFWSLSGNSGTNSSLNFLGTIDSVGLSIRTNNVEYLFVTPSGKLGIGTNNPHEQLELTKNIRIPKTHSASEGVVYVDSIPYIHNFGISNLFLGSFSGNFNLTGSKNIAIGDSSQFFLQNGDFNTSLGNNALQNNLEGSNNIAIGFNTLFNDSSGSNNTAIGAYAMMWNRKGHLNTSVGYENMYKTMGSYNSSLGAQALLNNQAGSQNVALGFQSLYSNISGSYNNAIGHQALFNNQTGNNNIAIGNKALYWNTVNANVAIGHNALYQNTTGIENTCIGYISLNHNIIGNSNTAMGFSALYWSNSDFNTAIGAYSLGNITNQNSNTALGYKSGILYSFEQSTFIGCESYPNNSGISNTTGIGYLSRPTANNQVRVGNTAVTSIGGFADWTNFSDERFKIPTNDEVKGLDFILKLEPIIYTINTDSLSSFLKENESETYDSYKIQLQKKSILKYTGFSAQQVLKAANDCNFIFSGVDIPQNNDDLYGLRYSNFVVPLVKAVQELYIEIQTLKNTIKELEEKIK